MQKGEHSKATRKRKPKHTARASERESSNSKCEPKEAKAKATRKTHKDIDDPQQHPKRPAANPLSP